MLLFAVAFVAYAVIGMVLSLHFHIVDGDGPSRVANAGYVLFSRDPHLAAVGFVWNPLPSLSELPVLLLAGIWPPLLTQGQAGTFMAAAFMAGAVWQVRGTAADRGLPTLWRCIVVAAFALNPMIVVYGGNGMSEAPFLFFTLWAARRLLRWMRRDQVGDLVIAGIALGFDYLARYEAAAAAGAAVVVVLSISALRATTPGRRERFHRGLVDATVVAFPFAVSFLCWTLSSWVIIGSAFPQFSSRYGNSSQIGTAGSGLQSFQHLAGGPVTIALRDVLYLAPLLPVIVVVVLVLAVRRADLDSLVPIALFGGILAFEAFGQLTGITFAWFRFFIMTVPLMVVLVVMIWPYRRATAGVLPSVMSWQGVASRVASIMRSHPLAALLLSPVGQPPSLIDRLRPAVRRCQRFLVRAGHLAHRMWRPFSTMDLAPRMGFAAGVTLVLCLLAPSFLSTWEGMLNPLVGTQSEQSGIHEIADPSKHPIPPSAFANNAYLVNYLDRLNLPDGSVLMDTYIGWDVWLQSRHRKQFVITSDSDFAQTLNAPQEYGIRYILVSDPKQDGRADAVNQRYPTLYRTGAGFASLVMTVASTGDDITWRLYRVDDSP